MVPFAGYEMPVQYGMGVLKEHLWTREKAGLFDVSHMGQAFIIPANGDFAAAAAAMEKLAAGDFLELEPGRQLYSQLLAENGGIVDDFMLTRMGAAGRESELYLVVNAACKERDFALLQEAMPAGLRFEPRDDLALLALQGPRAASVLTDHAPDVADLRFMRSLDLEINGVPLHISRSGYTGEDGFEISLPANGAPALWRLLSEHEDVEPVGLGARDSLRLEAGLCLYGHDIDETSSPVEAGLVWSIGKRRRREGGFPGARRILRELEEGPARKLVGILPEGRAPAREGVRIFSAGEKDGESGENGMGGAGGEQIGLVTSGGYGPSVKGPVAMGYVEARFAAAGEKIELEVRGKRLPARVAKLPFVPHRYHRGGKKAKT
jgi:aminomethyltransferase